MLKILKCETCGNLVLVMDDSELPIVCCGQQMSELEANTEDAAFEKHVPSVTADEKILHIQVGAVPHPMTEEHFIQWVIVETDRSFYLRGLFPNQKPECTFIPADDERAIAVYEYCTLHGLWKCSL